MTMPTRIRAARSVAVLALCAASCMAWGQTVKITPLGSNTGELCGRDRAMVIEDPSGLRLLYDPGQTLTGANDARVGKIDVILVSHAHGDHIGDRTLKAVGTGACDNAETVANFATMAGEIAAARNSALVVMQQMGLFLGRKIETLRGKPTGACPEKAGEVTAPLAAPCLATTHTGGTRKFRMPNAANAVEITMVTAAHDNTIPRELLHEGTRKLLDADNMSLTLGPPSGYVVRFSNGLVAYLSGDTGMHAEMKSVVGDYYKANLMVLNLGATAVTMQEAAHIANDLVRPASVIATHVNETATVNGKLRPGSRTAEFTALVTARPVYPAISGKTLEFNGAGACVAGCD